MHDPVRWFVASDTGSITDIMAFKKTWILKPFFKHFLVNSRKLSWGRVVTFKGKQERTVIYRIIILTAVKELIHIKGHPSLLSSIK